MKKITCIGNVGREPQTRTTKDGREFVEFSLAINDSNKSTMWVSVIMNRASKVVEYITKGKQLYIEGNFSLEVYKGEPSMTIFANEVQLLGKSDQLQAENSVVDRKPDVY